MSTFSRWCHGSLVSGTVARSLAVALAWMLLLCVETALADEPPAPPAPICIACSADFAAIRARYLAADWAALESGQVVTAEENAEAADPHAEPEAGRQTVVVASGILQERPADVWAALIDFAAWSHWMPNSAEATVTERRGDEVWLSRRIDVLWTSVRYRVVWTLAPALGLARWRLDPSVPHDIADTRGYWQLVPVEGGRATLVRYQAAVDSGRTVPRLVEETLTRRSLPGMLSGLREEVARRARR